VKSRKLFVKDLRTQARRHARFGVLAVSLISLAMPSFSHRNGGATPSGASRPASAQSSDRLITPIPFGEMNGADVYNASGAVPLADSRFLFCDNKTGDAFFELDLTTDGRMKGPLIRRPLQGVAAGDVRDLEGMTLAEEDGRRFIFATSSLCVKYTKGAAPRKVPSSGLLRVTINPNDSLSAENMPNFRDWFIQHAPDIGVSATLTPDEGGLNVEGLAWDQSRHALLFGLRSPLSADKPLVIPVRVKNLAGPWTTSNLEMAPPIRLLLNTTGAAQGVRSIEYITSQNSFLVLVGKAISKTPAPFALYQWNGNQLGVMRQLDVSFAEKMKPEGVTGGTIAGRPALLFVDDAGGYQVLWLDKARL